MVGGPRLRTGRLFAGHDTDEPGISRAGARTNSVATAPESYLINPDR